MRWMSNQSDVCSCDGDSVNMTMEDNDNRAVYTYMTIIFNAHETNERWCGVSGRHNISFCFIQFNNDLTELIHQLMPVAIIWIDCVLLHITVSSIQLIWRDERVYAENTHDLARERVQKW